MKWFCFLFSLYLLALTCLPCNDSEHDHAGQTAATTAYFSSASGYPGHQHCEDTCSPFCGCHCCSVTCTFRVIQDLKFQKFALPEQGRIFPAPALWLKGVSNAIDHPPRFV